MTQQLELTMEQLKELINASVAANIKELGLTAVDRRHIVVPTTDQLMGRQPISPERAQEISNFLRGVILPDGRFQQLTNDRGEKIGPFWRDLSVATPSAGGYLVPAEFRAAVIMEIEKLPVMRNICSVFPVAVKEDIPTVTGKPTITWGSENTAFTIGTLTFGTLPLVTNQANVYIPMSRKFAANTKVDINALLTKLFAQAFGRGEDTAFITGDGSGKPKGIRQEAVTSLAQAGANLAGDDLINLYHALPSQYRTAATWLMNDAVIAKVRKLKESTTGNYLWIPGLAGAPATILGRPVMEQNDIPTNLGTGSPPTESEIWFGDFAFYYIGDNETLSVEATTVGGDAFLKHQVIVKAWEEIDAKMALLAAFRKLTGVK